MTNRTLIAFSALLGALLFFSTTTQSLADGAATNGTPVLQFETTFFDFGKITTLGKVSGSFNFKNAGDGVLKLDPPKPSCGCTDAKATPDVLAPGQSGVISYTIKLDHPMGQVQKKISIYSNDPKNPDVQLTMQITYSPLYEMHPTVLKLTLPPGKDEAESTLTARRTDGLPASIARVESNQTNVIGVVDTGVSADVNESKIKVTVHRPATPMAKVTANLQLWDDTETNGAVGTVTAVCEVQGELIPKLAQIYWVMPSLGNSLTNYTTDMLTRTIPLDSAVATPVKIKNVSTDIKGLTASTEPQNDGKSFNLLLKFEQVPHDYITGNVIVETASETLPRLEIPVTISATP